jgi:hypothetical protein
MPEDRIHYFKGGSKQFRPLDGYIVEICPDGYMDWVGVFAIEYRSKMAVTHFSGLSDSEFVCIVAGGRGYVICAARPDIVKPVPSFPIVQVACCPALAQLAFADFTKIAIVDRSGTIWESRRVGWDGIRITEMTSDTIGGFAFDPFSNSDVPFAIDLLNRTVEGGSYSLRDPPA